MKNAFLDHDSYVELTQLHFLPDVHESEEIGSLTSSELIDLAGTVVGVPTLPQRDKDLIWERFGEWEG